MKVIEVEKQEVQNASEHVSPWFTITEIPLLPQAFHRKKSDLGLDYEQMFRAPACLSGTRELQILNHLGNRVPGPASLEPGNHDSKQIVQKT